MNYFASSYLIASIALGAIISTDSLAAQSHSINLSSNGNVTVFNFPNVIVQQSYLTDFVSGGQTAPFSFSIGDTIVATVRSTGSFTMPSSLSSDAILYIGPGMPGVFTADTSVSFKLNGNPVSSGFPSNQNSGSADNYFSLGSHNSFGYASFAFDEITFSSTIAQIYDASHIPVNSVTVPSGSGILAFSAVTPVPEPQTYSMLLAGLVFVGLLTRQSSLRRTQATRAGRRMPGPERCSIVA
jgi:hypothetical protein